MEDEINKNTNERLQFCQTCNKSNKECKLLRCSKCRKVFYCSIRCQKSDWKDGHRQICQQQQQQIEGGEHRSKDEEDNDIDNNNSNKMKNKGTTETTSHDVALQELFSLAMDMTMNESVEQYHKTNDEIKRRRQQQQQQQRMDQKETTSLQKEKLNMNGKQQQRQQTTNKVSKRDDTIITNQNVTNNNSNNKNISSSTIETSSSSSSPAVRKSMKTNNSDTWGSNNNNNINNRGFLIPSSLSSSSNTTTHISPSSSSSSSSKTTSSMTRTPPPPTTTTVGRSCEHQNYQEDPNISFVAEEMKYVSQLRILIRRKDTNNSNDCIGFNNIIQKTTKLKNSNVTVLTLKCKKSDTIIFVAEIPKSYDTQNCTIQVEGDHTIHIRIMKNNTDDIIFDRDGIVELPKGNLSIDDINDIHCKYCKSPLLLQSSLPGDNNNNNSSSSSIIQQELQLPTGHLEDIADYLICYNGQPTVDFSGSTIFTDPHVALQDSNVICLHRDALGTSSVCVLAVPGYGEDDDNAVTEDDDDEHEDESQGDPTSRKTRNEKSRSNKMTDILDNPSATIRGDRPWREGSSGGGGGDGATVCCSLCCSQLGFASSNGTYRFLKHRLTNSIDIQLSSTASFLAREMARYADVKAIFTFVVFRQQQQQQQQQQQPHNANDRVHHRRRRNPRKCLLLRLVSWDSRMATSYDEVEEEEDNDNQSLLRSKRRRLKFRQVAKIVFEETYEKIIKENDDDDDDITSMMTKKWIWGGVDLCCPPLNYEEENLDIIGNSGGTKQQQQQNTSSSTVKLQLPYDEYDEVLKRFWDGTKLFTKDVADTTILVKMGGGGGGRNTNTNNNFALTAIPLDQ